MPDLRLPRTWRGAPGDRAAPRYPRPDHKPRQQRPDHGPLRARHVRGIPPNTLRAIGRIPEPVSDAITRRSGRVDSTGTSTYNRGNRVSWISVGFATPSHQEALPSCPQPTAATQSRLPFETHPSRSERQQPLKAFRHGKQAGKWLADNHPRFFVDTTADSKFDSVGCHDDGVWVSLQDEDSVFVEPLHVLDGFRADHGGLGKKRPRLLAVIVGFGGLGVQDAASKPSRHPVRAHTPVRRMAGHGRAPHPSPLDSNRQNAQNG